MKIFHDYTFPWYDMGVLKWTTLFVGLYFGQAYHEFFQSWSNLIGVIALVGLVYLVGKYWKQVF